jgi:adenylate cyclase
MSSKLLVKNTKTGQEFEFPILAQEVRMGRANENNELVLNDDKVSRWHAVLRQNKDSYTLVDLNSVNHTLVNDRQISEQKLRNGDVIGVGGYRLTFVHEVTPTINLQQMKLGNTILLRAPTEILSQLAPASFKSDVSVKSSPEVLLREINRLKKRSEILSHIYELDKMLNSVFLLQDIFAKLCDVVFRLTQADRFFVLLKEKKSDQMLPYFMKFRDDKNTRSTRDISISKTVVEQVTTSRMSLLSSDAATDARLAGSVSIIYRSIHSVICVPLIVQEKLVGVIYTDCANPMSVLGEDDLDLVNALAATASMSIDNAESHQQLMNEALARSSYSRFMPEHLVNSILESPEEFRLGGVNQQATMFFSDIRGFTSMSETMEPEVLIQLLNKYFSETVPIIFSHGGLLDKFIGDGTMALFGVPNAHEECAIEAVGAAIEIQQRMLTLNPELRDMGLPEISVGIGINTGLVTVGFVGSDKRTDYSAIGDAVNLAARLEKQAEKGQIVISQYTVQALKGAYPVRQLEARSIKGKREPVMLYEVLWEGVSTARRTGSHPEFKG